MKTWDYDANLLLFTVEHDSTEKGRRASIEGTVNTGSAASQVACVRAVRHCNGVDVAAASEAGGRNHVCGKSVDGSIGGVIGHCVAC